MNKIFGIFVFLFLISCSNIEFVYEGDKGLINPLYEKTHVKTSGIDEAFINSYISTLFGTNKENQFNLLIKIEEKQTKRSVKLNQTVSNLRYELNFKYNLKLNGGCTTYKKEILSYFSIKPKSSGYNYGTDISLEKNYELAVMDNLNRFLSFLENENINECK